MKILICVAVIAGAMLVLVNGCKDDTAGNPPPKPMTDAELKRQIDAVENNPNIPAANKPMIEGQIKSAAAMIQSHSKHGVGGPAGASK